MDTTTNLPTTRAPALAYRLLRYAPKAVRDEWINIGVLVFAQHSNDFRLRMVEEHDEFSRLRRLWPRTDENLIRRMRDHLEERIVTFLANERREREDRTVPSEPRSPCWRTGEPSRTAQVLLAGLEASQAMGQNRKIRPG